MTRKIALIVGVAVFGALAASIVLLHLSVDAMCGNELLARLPSPDKQLDAIVFERDCGATTGFSTQVTVLAHGSGLPNRPGNIAAFDDNHGAAPQGPAGGPDVRVAWEGRRDLVLYHHPDAGIFKRAITGIGVRFAPLGR